MKKGISPYMNYLLPAEGHGFDAPLGQHQRRRAEIIIFFGPSGTGKTTL